MTTRQNIHKALPVMVRREKLKSRNVGIKHFPQQNRILKILHSSVSIVNSKV